MSDRQRKNEIEQVLEFASDIREAVRARPFSSLSSLFCLYGHERRDWFAIDKDRLVMVIG